MPALVAGEGRRAAGLGVGGGKGRPGRPRGAPLRPPPFFPSTRTTRTLGQSGRGTSVTTLYILPAELAAKIAQASSLPRDAFDPKSRKQNARRRPRPRDTRDSDFNKRAKAAKKANKGPAKF